MVEIEYFVNEQDVQDRLATMDLELSALLEVRSVARSAASNVTANHCKTAPGTYAYQDGTFALRDRIIGEHWKYYFEGGIEGIANERRKLRIIFSNVDLACSKQQGPKPTSSKGPGSERLCEGNLLFPELREYVSPPRDDVATFYLMVDEKGAVELTRPVIKRGTYVNYVERIFLSDGDDMDSELKPFETSDRADGFDPSVARKM